ncbi:CsgG/HfaB family protein [Arundinibacter roseus]|uniref:Curli production assembly protein CsgG n=1 Tax=Arundinibacter roseus TaxID=2070510 RepID=A0A4R4KBC9_9BACT|nr:CsgG/HfaB family protein [Arundinibacter roseus]TDB64052.1 curli production assembly protein CsgG [Arundinibacter roseus]
MQITNHLLKGCLLVVGLMLYGCRAYFHQPTKLEQARLGEETTFSEELRSLPAPKEALATAVYKFRDQTGQYKPSDNASWSTAVTQGATNILLKAMEDSKWFLNIERENVSNLLNERKIIRSSMSQYNKAENDVLPPLLFAGMILEGGIVSYDANIITGGAGLRYFGAGGSTEYRQDRVTVYLRAIATRSGKILKTVYSSKTILSQSVNASLFRYVRFKRILEAETGFTTNEPSQMAVTEAIEKAVHAMVLEGIKDGLWAAADADSTRTKEQIKLYEEEKKLMALTDVYGIDNAVERPRISLMPYASAFKLQGDYQVPSWQPGGGVQLNAQLTPNWGLIANGFRSSFSTSTSDRTFTLKRNWRNADLSVVYMALPFQKYSPFLTAGAGISQVSPLNDFSADTKTFHFAKAGAGLEVSLTKYLGLRAMMDYYWMTTDMVDGVKNGQLNDSFLRVSVGTAIYIGKASRKRVLPLPAN